MFILRGFIQQQQQEETLRNNLPPTQGQLPLTTDLAASSPSSWRHHASVRSPLAKLHGAISLPFTLSAVEYGFKRT